jgi:hypothetical protein
VTDPNNVLTFLPSGDCLITTSDSSAVSRPSFNQVTVKVMLGPIVACVSVAAITQYRLLFTEPLLSNGSCIAA